MYVLDTNVVSELRKVGNNTCDPNVLSWSNKSKVASFYLSCITLMELEIGCLSLTRRDVRQASVLRSWISDFVLATFHDRILAFDQACALICAALHVPDRKPERDAMIVATAIRHDFILVTRNTRDFQNTGARLVNPWDD